MTSSSDALVAPNVLEYPYTRSTGPVIGRFMTALRAGRILGVRTGAGRVVCPPTEYDPATGEALGGDDGDFVEVGPGGVITTWAWVHEPRERHPLERPFAWALVRLDGADTAMVHIVDAADESALRTGMRVSPRWRAERVGEIHDIEAFVPEDASREASVSERSTRSERPEGRPAGIPPAEASDARDKEPVTMIDTPIELHYRFTAGTAPSRFLRGVEQGRLVGQRCPQCRKVYVPPRGSCPACGVATDEDVELGAAGTVTTFCVVNVPFYGQTIEIPYVSATILMDGADIGLMHLVQECDAADVHMGMRVEPVWVDPVDRTPSLESIQYFRPTSLVGSPRPTP